MGTTYDIGDLVTVTVQFATATGSTNYLDPATVYLHYKNPAGTVTTDLLSSPTTSSTIIGRSDTGEFYADITTTGQGLYEGRWFSTGVITTAEQWWFSVRPNRVST